MFSSQHRIQRFVSAVLVDNDERRLPAKIATELSLPSLPLNDLRRALSLNSDAQSSTVDAVSPAAAGVDSWTTLRSIPFERCRFEASEESREGVSYRSLHSSIVAGVSTSSRTAPLNERHRLTPSTRTPLDVSESSLQLMSRRRRIPSYPSSTSSGNARRRSYDFASFGFKRRNGRESTTSQSLVA